MILVDTSVWVNHFRHGDNLLVRLLMERRVACHPMIIGELACGQLPQRRQTLADLKSLHQCRLLDDHDVLSMIDNHQLMGLGLGYIDMHLLASTLADRCRIWSADKKLAAIADRMNFGFDRKHATK